MGKLTLENLKKAYKISGYGESNEKDTKMIEAVVYIYNEGYDDGYAHGLKDGYKLTNKEYKEE